MEKFRCTRRRLQLGRALYLAWAAAWLQTGRCPFSTRQSACPESLLLWAGRSPARPVPTSPGSTKQPEKVGAELTSRHCCCTKGQLGVALNPTCPRVRRVFLSHRKTHHNVTTCILAWVPHTCASLACCPLEPRTDKCCLGRRPSQSTFESSLSGQLTGPHAFREQAGEQDYPAAVG